ncbi:MAG: rRNA maturation RNase YbeY [Nitrospira sp.]|uniref:rRNA maturation RNase YbeY n=1 Tax=Nitrospira cf. moscoviensis SBR1015 TaxID=96242 RepID=UPI000A3C797D|nr:rRNA maturation RNase YbeY [Nitrospira cf. moscoviensis SBR1015]MBH0207080.1 rRNA maturation RNase YbeY [Nitrospira sp.]
MAVCLRVRLRKHLVRQARLVELAQRVLSVAGEAQSELSLELIGDRRMRRLNRDYRQRDRTTDVLAFSTREAVVPKGLSCPTSLLGDVVISLPTAIRQARAGGRSVDEELAILLVHGVLHLCGYDHERNAHEAERMSRREQAVLRRISPVPPLITIRPGRRIKGD